MFKTRGEVIADFRKRVSNQKPSALHSEKWTVAWTQFRARNRLIIKKPRAFPICTWHSSLKKRNVWTRHYKAVAVSRWQPYLKDLSLNLEGQAKSACLKTTAVINSWQREALIPLVPLPENEQTNFGVLPEPKVETGPSKPIKKPFKVHQIQLFDEKGKLTEAGRDLLKKSQKNSAASATGNLKRFKEPHASSKLNFQLSPPEPGSNL